MLKTIAALVLGAAILLPTAAAFADSSDKAGDFAAPVQTEPLYLGPINAPVQVDTVNDMNRDSHDHGFDQ